MTAGAIDKQKGYEPDLEGKVRTLAAIEDLENSAITDLIIAGGMRFHNQSLGEIYRNYAVRFTSKVTQVSFVEGGIETGSDLRQALYSQKGDKKSANDQIVVYSSGFHGQRAREICRREGIDVVTVAAEEKILQRWNKVKTSLLGKWFGIDYYSLVDMIFNREFIQRMQYRERIVRSVLRLDDVPIVGAHLKLGSRLIEFLAKGLRA